MDILKNPPAAAELFELAKLGGIPVKDLVNPKSRVYKELGIDTQNFSEQETADYLTSNPKAMFRPLLTDGKNLVVGFEPEKMEKILQVF